MMTLLRTATELLAAASLGGLVWALAMLPVPPTPRLGHRGLVRHQCLERSALFAAAESWLRFIAGLVALLPIGTLRVSVEKRLLRAGHFLGLTSDEFLALSVVSAFLLGGVTAWVGNYFHGLTAGTVFGSTLGLLLPTFQVNEAIGKRAKAVTRALPHSIEIASLCMGAGLDFPGALRMLVSSSTNSVDPLTEELGAILEELDLGHTRRQALQNFADRVQTSAVRDFVNAVIQAEQKGNPLAKVIQVQGRMLSMQRSVLAEEAAARAGVLMIAPCALLMGCVLLLVMGPFIVQGIGF